MNRNALIPFGDVCSEHVSVCRCLPRHLQPVPCPDSCTCVHQEHLHCTSNETLLSNMPEWLPPCSTHTHCNEVPWAAGPGLTQDVSAPHWTHCQLDWTNLPTEAVEALRMLHSAALCTVTPGQQEHICKNSVCWFQLSIQYIYFLQAHH